MHSKSNSKQCNSKSNNHNHNHSEQQEDPTQKLKKYSDLKQQGVITEEEFMKLKADLLSKM